MDLKKKVGPMPVWAWGASAAGLTVAVILWQRHKASKVPSSANSNTAANASFGYASVPVPTGGGYSYAGDYPVQNTGTGTESTAPKHPYLGVADIADLQQALDAGIPQDWLAYVGSDPAQAKAATDPTYAPPQGLPTLASLGPDADIAYGGIANQIAPSNATKVYGKTRKGTAQAMQQWYQAFQQYGQNVGYYVPS